MARPKPDSPHVEIMLRVSPELAAIIDHNRGAQSRNQFVGAILNSQLIGRHDPMPQIVRHVVERGARPAPSARLATSGGVRSAPAPKPRPESIVSGLDIQFGPRPYRPKFD